MTSSPVILAIDGPFHTEKAKLATELAARLRERQSVSVIHLSEVTPAGPGFAARIEDFLETRLAPLKTPDVQPFSSGRHLGPSADTHIPVPDVVIVEGTGAGSLSARKYIDAVIWAATPDDLEASALLEDPASFHGSFPARTPGQEDRLNLDVSQRFADICIASQPDEDITDDLLRALRYLPGLRLALPSTHNGEQIRVLSERIECVPDPVKLFEGLYGQSVNSVWLDSSLKDPGSTAQRSRFSILADDDGCLGKSVQHRSGLTSLTVGAATVRTQEPFFRWLERVWGQETVQAPEGYDCGFTLGWIGFLGYELKRETGGGDVSAPTPDAALIFAARAVVLDHLAGTAWLLSIEAPDTAAWFARARSAVASASSATVNHDASLLSPIPDFSSRDSETGYKEKIVRAQGDITEGNTYEVCLTTALTAKVASGPEALDPWQTYLALRRRNPAPFASFLRFGALAVASTSPERFLRITTEGAMRAEPIKGTRARSKHPKADRRLRDDLVASSKDRAENIMIVDLLRNDLSHFALPGSVKVSRLCDIESYATVHQMVSTIDAQLRLDLPRAQAVAACFPAGSMTGAPKISTMAILDHLEGAPRGVYSGAIGYFSITGATDLSVAIRTLVINSRPDGSTELSLGIGGAITCDSTPEDEYKEIRTKAHGVLSALGASFPTAPPLLRGRTYNPV